MHRAIEIIDQGRGMQLSTSRVTVQDLVPYFQDRCSYEEIMRWIPTLTTEELRLSRNTTRRINTDSTSKTSAFGNEAKCGRIRLGLKKLQPKLELSD